MSKADRIMRRRSDGWSATQAIHSKGKIGRSLQTLDPPTMDQIDALSRDALQEYQEYLDELERGREIFFQKARRSGLGQVQILYDEYHGLGLDRMPTKPIIQRKTKSERREERKQQIAVENRQRQYESSSLF